MEGGVTTSFPLSPIRLTASARQLAVILLVCLVPGVATAADGTFGEAVARGPLYAAGVALLGGLLVSLTPCVYPMIAITVSIFGAKQSQGRLHALGLSSSFVLGIMAMFTPLGVIAGLTGGFFGSVLQNTWVLVGMALLFLAMAASLFGAFEVALPSALTNRLARVGGIGVRGAFGLGLACGLIAAPCTGPVLTGILTWIAQNQSAWAGGLAMAAFALGLGFPFFLVGTFAVHLPKSGRWMIHIKSLLAIVMAVVGLYYLSVAFPSLVRFIRPSPALFAIAGAVALLGLALGAVHRDFGSPDLQDKIFKSLGASVTTLALFTITIAWGTASNTLSWVKVPYAEASQSARSLGKPLLVDFTATWCGACKELDKNTFADERVSAEAGRFVAVKVDATDDEDPSVKSIMTSLSVVGLPTVILFDSRGTEVTRFNDYVSPDEFLRHLRNVK